MTGRIIVAYLIALFGCMNASAQVLYTAANAFPPFGKYTCSVRGQVDIPPQTFPTSGTGVVWNFNSIPWGAPDPEVYYVQPASWTYPSIAYPTADVCIWNAGPWGEGWYNYFKFQGDSLLHIGDASYQEDITFYTFETCPSPAVRAHFPTQLGDELLWDSYTCPGSPTVVRTFLREYLARGTLNVGGTSTANVVLARETVTTNGNEYRSYIWLAPNNMLRNVMRYYYEDGAIFWTQCSAGSLGIEDRVDMLGFRCMPNPATAMVRLQLTPHAEWTTVVVHDQLGKELMRVAVAPGRTEAELNVADLDAGVYQCVRRGGSSLATQRLVVAH